MHDKKSRSRKIIIIVVSAAVLISAAAAAFGYYSALKRKKADEQYLRQVQAVVNDADSGVFYDGVYIAETYVGGMKKTKALKKIEKLQKTLRPDINIKVKTPDGIVKLDEDDFEFSYDTKKIVNQAYNYGKSGSDEERYKIITGLKSEKKEFNVTAELEMSSVNGAVKKVAQKVDIEVIEPRISDFLPNGSQMFIISDGKNGRALDRDDLKQKLKAILKTDSKTGTVKAVTHVLRFTDTTVGIEKRAEKKGEFSTYSVNVAAANDNMRLALKSVNGTRLEPGEVFSFNASTGDTTNGSNGYKKAGAINNGKLIEEYGGGICQASTTIYGAALRADMEIVERHNHTWPSVYVPIGQDASVNYPSSDFKFRNNKSYPVFICARMEGTKLTVEIFGDRDKDRDYDEIKVTSEKTETIPRPSAIRQSDGSLAPGKTEVERTGRDGYRARAYKVYYKNGSVVRKREIASSYYPPVAEIIKVGK